MPLRLYKILITILVLCLTQTIEFKGFSQVKSKQYVTRSYIKELKTLKVTKNGEFDSPPLIELNGEDRIKIDFDILGDDEKWIGYRIYHLDHEWHKSNISQQEYFDGFDNNQLDFSENSFNTFVNYRHYSLEIPNENFKLIKSGNYAIEFFEVNDPETIISSACFSIYEPMVDLLINVNGNTDIDYNRGNQQLTPIVKVKDNSINNIATDLILVVSQNGRRDTERKVYSPSRFSTDKAFYEHNKDLIFNAGNNYRRFDISDHKYASIGVEKIRFIEPLYYAFLYPDLKRNNQPFTYDNGHNGRYIVRSVGTDNSDIEADYVNVMFSLESNFPLTGLNVYLSGEFTNDRFDDSSKMIYNEQARRYEKNMLLKQGHYNYIYLVKQGDKQGNTSLIEGDFYETPNSYMVKVFYRKPGERYDKLIGIYYN